MFTYENMKSNYETIKEICEKYRKELTVYGGVLGESIGLIDCSEYVKFMNELSFEEFVGNFMSGLLNEDVISIYRDVLDGNSTFEEIVSLSGEDVKNYYLEELKKF